MAISTRQQQFIGLWSAFKAQNPIQVLGPNMSFSDFDGPSLGESQHQLQFVVETIDALIASDSLKELTWNALTGLQGQIQNVHNTFTPLASTRDQGSYQNFAQQLDSLAYHTRLMGLPYLATGGGQLERSRAQIDAELDRLVSTRREVEQLRDNVRTLITPAVAGSLSQAFTTRRDALLVGRIVWAVAALLLGGFAVYATFSFASVVGEAMKAASTATSSNHDIVWAGAIIRSIVLIPLFAAFGFAFAQYKKERDFEEEYAHKAAVATSLPNYGELARDAAVRDQIVTGATGVIFTSPTAQFRAAGEKGGKSLKDVTALIEAASKLAGPKV